MSGPAPIIGVTLATSAFFVLALALRRAHMANKALVEIPLLSFMVSITTTGTSLATEGILLTVLFESGLKFQGLAILLLLSRVSHVVPLFVIYWQNRVSAYFALLDEKHLDDNKFVYSALICLSMVETALLRYLPWTHSVISINSFGYPDLTIMRLCSYTKVLQSIATSAAQFSFIIFINSATDIDNVEITSLVFFLISLCITVFSLLLALYEAVMRIRMIQEIIILSEQAALLQSNYDPALLEAKLEQIRIETFSEKSRLEQEVEEKLKRVKALQAVLLIYEDSDNKAFEMVNPMHVSLAKGGGGRRKSTFE